MLEFDGHTIDSCSGGVYLNTKPQDQARVVMRNSLIKNVSTTAHSAFVEADYDPLPVSARIVSDLGCVCAMISSKDCAGSWRRFSSAASTTAPAAAASSKHATGLPFSVLPSSAFNI